MLAKSITTFSLIMACVFSQLAVARDHEHHAKHNMLVFGVNETFASHIVYKNPHNFQVILRLRFDDKVQRAYTTERQAHPSAKIFLLLNPMNIAEIADAVELTGALLREDENGERSTIVPEVKLQSTAFDLVYFSELPLSLGVGID